MFPLSDGLVVGQDAGERKIVLFDSRQKSCPVKQEIRITTSGITYISLVGCDTLVCRILSFNKAGCKGEIRMYHVQNDTLTLTQSQDLDNLDSRTTVNHVVSLGDNTLGVFRSVHDTTTIHAVDIYNLSKQTRLTLPNVGRNLKRALFFAKQTAFLQEELQQYLIPDLANIVQSYLNLNEGDQEATISEESVHMVLVKKIKSDLESQLDALLSTSLDKPDAQQDALMILENLIKVIQSILERVESPENLKLSQIKAAIDDTLVVIKHKNLSESGLERTLNDLSSKLTVIPDLLTTKSALAEHERMLRKK
jgi:hypothetical protein